MPVLQKQGCGTLVYEERTVHQDLMRMGDGGRQMLGPDIDKDKYIVMMQRITNCYDPFRRPPGDLGHGQTQ
ncbi:hypothetical protein PPUN14671_35180 [Pseudomonas putida]|uniref:Uncharacterized protein n=1 Tax=Pseudomonas putida TaxID=303 RepID=A0AA37RB25_PSEPU|nr:hypothetical protein PPUN14671_35180 [Pseudomonas putida]